MNISAPISVPDLASPALLLAAIPNAAAAIPGSAPPQSLSKGAGTFHNFESTLADLLSVEQEPEKKPEETQTMITGVAVPAPPETTLPFEFGLPFQPAVKTDATGLCQPTADLELMSVGSQGTDVKKGKSLPTQAVTADYAFDVSTPKLADAQATPPDANQPALEIVEPTAATVPDLMPVAELPHLAFTEKFTPKPDTQAEAALSVGHPQQQPAKSPAESLPPPAAPDIARPAPASEQKQGGTDQQHSSKEPLPQPRSNPDPTSREEARVEKPSFEALAPVTATARETAPTQWPPSAPAAKSVQIPRTEPEPSRVQSTPSSQTVDTHSISMRVTDAGDTHVDLKVTEHAGEVKVTVRTADSDLSSSLRENLGDLVHRMEQSGFRADTWHPAQANALDDNPRSRHAEGEPPGGESEGRQQQQNPGDSQQRKQQDPERARWIEELETNFTPDSERKAPIWPPVSVH